MGEAVKCKMSNEMVCEINAARSNLQFINMNQSNNFKSKDMIDILISLKDIIIQVYNSIALRVQYTRQKIVSDLFSKYECDYFDILKKLDLRMKNPLTC